MNGIYTKTDRLNSFLIKEEIIDKAFSGEGATRAFAAQLKLISEGVSSLENNSERELCNPFSTVTAEDRAILARALKNINSDIASLILLLEKGKDKGLEM